MANISSAIATTTINSSTKLGASLVSSASRFFFNFENFTNLWVNMGFVAGCVLVLCSAVWLCSCICCRGKMSQQESWCWCIFCCPEIELPLVAKKVQMLPTQQPIIAWSPPPNNNQLYGQQH